MARRRRSDRHLDFGIRVGITDTTSQNDIPPRPPPAWIQSHLRHDEAHLDARPSKFQNSCSLAPSHSRSRRLSPLPVSLLALSTSQTLMTVRLLRRC
ncbi:hypothetical protein FIBSPDRAFT_877155 [Athelia psychrophila]|uniref:Uncharacterized protein n=1 Tax=Athelia psychrophila TaxID=1759441 RepID=A0A167W7I0_9AGAM|nr:hypothetical protein FIBSPDRAFT_877155 [Fibularhizoctonia sp. CBS 109695]